MKAIGDSSETREKIIVPLGLGFVDLKLINFGLVFSLNLT
jgi:hypothetical protein